MNKPKIAIVGNGNVGTASTRILRPRAGHRLEALVFLNVPAMVQPEAYLGGADKMGRG